MRALVVAVCSLVGLALGGCTAQFNAFQIPIEGGEGLTSEPVRLVVDNDAGDVIIEARPDLDGPRVTAIAHRSGTGERSPVTWDGHEGASTTAVVDRASGAPTLRVTGRTSGHEQIDLYIRTPTIHGVDVRTTGGQVQLTRVSGPIRVSNAQGTGDEMAPIQLRTNAPLSEGVTLTTDRGDITCYASEQTAGALEMTTVDGDVRWISENGTVTNARAARGHYAGTLNGGGAPIRMSTGYGVVRLSLFPNAGDTVPDHHMANFERALGDADIPVW